MLLIYGDVMKIMIAMDEHFSFPALVTVLMTMNGLFRVGYKMAFHFTMFKKYLLLMMLYAVIYLLLQLQLMISAVIINESAGKLKTSVRSLPTEFSKKHLERLDLRKYLMQDNRLTLWSIYPLNRSLIIANLGGLLTLGILLGSLGQ
ncbi:hypothetical protein AVEN_157579-1 [Araneus ventricosus]|uniref:Gustatory receptor n=1 Tax=Araneus ventricosus TaxID=182803 RepID=A0A4Y2Q097_ARAVE|nr:hypothetical protein AVEN_157579-1 [Araneus ventricosus]